MLRPYSWLMPAMLSMLSIENVPCITYREYAPPLATILINMYREPSELFVDGNIIWSQEGTTQGDPLAMAMYALATIPLIHSLKSEILQVWYADDASAVGKISSLRDWWNRLSSLGPSYGYFANASKTWLITKQQHLEAAQSCFLGTGVNITGRPYLGSPIGTDEYINSFVKNKVHQWSTELKTLANIATTQPHAAYAAYTHGLTSRWSYLSRTTPNISDELLSLEAVIRTEFLPTISGRAQPGDLECELLAPPARLGGIAVPNPAKAEPLIDLILSNDLALPRGDC